MPFEKRICVVGPSKLFFSGLTTHSIFLGNALSAISNTSALLINKLLPRFLYPGKDRIGKGVFTVDFKPAVTVFNGMNWYSPLTWFQAYRFLRKQRPDAIIILWWTCSIAHMQLFLVLVNLLDIKAKLIIEMHEVTDHIEERSPLLKLYSRLTGRIITKAADYITTQSNWAKDEMVKNFKVDPEKISVIPVGLYDEYGEGDRLSSRQEFSIPDDEFVILYFGAIKKYKGIPYLIKAFDRLPRETAVKARLMIIGENWGDDDELESVLEQSVYRDRITYTPAFIADEMIPRYFAASDAVVLPYLRSCGSGIANIAMSFGRPVIASDIDTMQECLGSYQGTSLFTTGDIESLKEVIQQQYLKWAEGSRSEFPRPDNTWDSIARQYLDLVQDGEKTE